MSKVYATTTTSKLGRKESVRIANMALRWCRNTLGVNRRKKYAPVWYIARTPDWDKAVNGYYDPSDNIIVIYWDNCHNVQDIIATCIHEWTHQNQPILTQYSKYSGPYDSNPYEIEATMNETVYGAQCWNVIKAKINKTK
jgi:hypothetical protein